MRNEIIRDGKTRYIYTAFSDSDTGENMQTQPYDGYEYVGSFESDQIETETDPTRYKWNSIEAAGKDEDIDTATETDIQETLNETIRTATLYADEYMQVIYEDDDDEISALIIRRKSDDYNVRIDADSLDVRNGEHILASFGETVYIAPKSEWDTGNNNGAITMEEGRITMGSICFDWYAAQPLFDLNVEADETGEVYTETVAAVSSLDLNPNRVVTTKPIAAVISAYNNTKGGYITLENCFAYLTSGRDKSTIYFNASESNYPDEGDRVTVKYRTLPNTMVMRGDIVASNIIANNTIDTGWIALGVNTAKFKLYNSTAPIKYRRIGKMVEVRGAVSPKSNIAGSSNENVICTLPDGFRPGTELRYVFHGSGRYKWLCRVKTSGEVSFERYAVIDSYATADTSAWIPFNFTFMID